MNTGKTKLFTFLFVFILMFASVSAVPTLTQTIPDIELEYNDNEGHGYNSFINNYDELELIFNHNGQQHELFGGTSMSAFDTYTSNEFDVDLISSGGNVFSIFYSYTTDINFDVGWIATQLGSGTISGIFNVDIDEFQFSSPPSNDPPSQVASLPNILLDHQDSDALILNNYFNDFDEIEVSFNDPIGSQSVVLTHTVGGSMVDYDTNHLLVQLQTTSGFTVLTFFSENDDFGPETVTVKAINDFGDDEGTFQFEIEEQTPPSPPPPAGVDLENGLIVYYSADDGTFSGTTLDDLSGNNNDGTASNSAIFDGDGIINEGLDLFSTNYVELPSLLFNDNQGSVSIWTYREGVSGSSEYAFFHFGGGDNRFYVMADGNNIETRLGTNVGRNTGVNWDIDEWNHILVTADNGDFKVYKNAIEIMSDTYAGDITSQSSTVTRLGISSANTNRYDGLVDEIGVWDRVLNIDEIEELYANGNPSSDQQPPFVTAPPPASFDVTQTTLFQKDKFVDISSDPMIIELNDYISGDEYDRVYVNVYDPVGLSVTPMLQLRQVGSDTVTINNELEVTLQYFGSQDGYKIFIDGIDEGSAVYEFEIIVANYPIYTTSPGPSAGYLALENVDSVTGEAVDGTAFFLNVIDLETQPPLVLTPALMNQDLTLIYNEIKDTQLSFISNYDQVKVFYDNTEIIDLEIEGFGGTSPTIDLGDFNIQVYYAGGQAVLRTTAKEQDVVQEEIEIEFLNEFGSETAEFSITISEEPVFVIDPSAVIMTHNKQYVFELNHWIPNYKSYLNEQDTYLRFYYGRFQDATDNPAQDILIPLYDNTQTNVESPWGRNDQVLIEESLNFPEVVKYTLQLKGDIVSDGSVFVREAKDLRVLFDTYSTNYPQRTKRAEIVQNGVVVESSDKLFAIAQGVFQGGVFVPESELSGTITPSGQILPSFIPSPPQGQEGVWSVLIILGVALLIMFGTRDVDGRTRMIGVTAWILASIVLFGFLGWLPIWIPVVVGLAVVLVLAGVIYKRFDN